MMTAKRTSIICALIVAMIIFLPVVWGYTMTFDMAWGPNYPISNINNNIWLISLIIHTLGLLLPSWIIQKIILILIVVMSFTGINKMLDSLTNKPNYVYLIASLLYVFNPYFYTRLISGQWLVLCGYALLPWVICSIYIFLQKPSWRTAIHVAIWSSAICLLSIHTIGFVALVGLALCIYSGRTLWKEKLKWLLIVAGIWTAVNSIWLIPFMLGKSMVSQEVAGFGYSQLEAFATRGTIGNSVQLSAALLTGFWADNQNRYILPSHLPIWWLGVVLLFTVICYGLILIFKSKDRLGIVFFIVGVIAWFLGIGISWAPSAYITDVLIKIFPFYIGYREPQKWLMVVSLVYTYFFAIGASSILKYFKENRKNDMLFYGLITLLFVAPFLYTPSLPWGAAGQLRGTDYPKSWYDAKTFLDHQASPNSKVLIFPWHTYLPLSWVGRVVANPASYFFNEQMITSDNLELNGVPPQNTTPTKTYISDYIIPNITYIQNTGSKLTKFGISYILLEKENDYARYQPFLDHQTDLKKVYDNNKISIYKVELN